MYQSHWGLDRQPFRGRLDLHFFHESPTHEEALARLHYLVEEHRRLGLLMGTTGSGKSLLLEVVAKRLRRVGVPVARTNLTAIEPAEFLWQLAAALGINPAPSVTGARLWQRLTDRIIEHRYQQLPTVLLLDDADQAATGVLDQVVRLAQFDPVPQSRLTIVLAGRHQRIGRIGARLLELAELRIDVEPWEATDTAEYLNLSLQRAGRDAPVFAERALTRLHELTDGVPRRVNQLADLSLMAGAGRGLPQVDAETVESVHHELGVIEV